MGISYLNVLFNRLQDAIVVNEVRTNTLSDALIALELLRSTLHAYNKKIAEVSSAIHPRLGYKEHLVLFLIWDMMKLFLYFMFGDQ